MNQSLFSHAFIVLAVALGGGSMLLLVLFLFLGPFGWIDLGFGSGELLVWNTFLSLAFFVQHSVMVRRWFRRRLECVISHQYHGALYSIASGVTLLAVILLWQESSTRLVQLDGPTRWVSRLLFVAAFAGFHWGKRALRRFDPFGIDPILARMRGRESTGLPLAIRGPYRWVRHPLYFFVLVLMWSYPDLTADRLLFDLLWTGWIVIGSILEERDLVAEFGDDYREYRRHVPMLIPWRAPAPSGAASTITHG